MSSQCLCLFLPYFLDYCCFPPFARTPFCTFSIFQLVWQPWLVVVHLPSYLLDIVVPSSSHISFELGHPKYSQIVLLYRLSYLSIPIQYFLVVAVICTVSSDALNLVISFPLISRILLPLVPSYSKHCTVSFECGFVGVHLVFPEFFSVCASHEHHLLICLYPTPSYLRATYSTGDLSSPQTHFFSLLPRALVRSQSLSFS